MDAKRKRFFRDYSIQNKMLLIILPLIVVPMLILATVGFITASRGAAKTSTRYLKQRENDLRTLAENPAIRDYFNNLRYGLAEEAEVYRHELERSLKRFAERSNSIEWSNDYASVVSKKTFVRMARALCANLRRWARRRHPNKSAWWVSEKYWHPSQGQWTFKTTDGITLQQHSALAIRR